MDTLTFKVADEPWELEQIHRLNYRTFVEEIPQHAPNQERSLVDGRLARSLCYVCLEGRRLVGMIAICGERPFSLDSKLPDLDAWLPPHRRACEIRLLSVVQEKRGGAVFAGLLQQVIEHARTEGYDLGVISGTERQASLYQHLGFVPFGPPIGTREAPYRAMYCTWDRLAPSTMRLLRPGEPVNLLPGPVAIEPAVREEFSKPPLPTRSEEFMRLFGGLRQRLRRLTGARHVQVLSGSGTLANDAVAAQLARQGGRGALLVNGEFGERLGDHASRAGLSFDLVRSPWGSPLAYDKVPRSARWLWAVHCETSTGVLNDLPTLQGLAAERGALLCLDAVSSVGTVPVDLSGVFLASAVSGKALAGYPGLSMVFHDHEIAPLPSLPRALDLGLYAEHGGVPFTLPGNLVAALELALRRFDDPQVYGETAALSRWLRPHLPLPVMAEEAHSSPAVLTLVPPPEIDAGVLGEHLERLGYQLACRSAYLARRNLIQICLMGRHTLEELLPLPRTIEAALRRSRVR